MILFRDNQKKIDEAILPLKAKLGELQVWLAKIAVPSSHLRKLHVRVGQNWFILALKTKLEELQVWAGQNSCSFLLP